MCAESEVVKGRREGTKALILWEDECDGDDDKGDWRSTIRW